MDTDANGPPAAQDEAVLAFWELARSQARLNPAPGYFGPTPRESVPPPAWSFGTTAREADELLELVLAGVKTATASVQWEYEAEGEPLPQPGTLGIVLDGRGRPRALLETTQVEIVPFDRVSAEHAYLEGEGDRSLEYWREVHRHFFSEQVPGGEGFRPDLPVVLERFVVLYSDR